MKPPYCHLCGAPLEWKMTREGQPDGLVHFADYEPLPKLMCGHPRGAEWFCAAHFTAARALAHRPVAHAVAALGGSRVRAGKPASLPMPGRWGSIRGWFYCIALVLISVAVLAAVGNHLKAKELAGWRVFREVHHCQAVVHKPPEKYTETTDMGKGPPVVVERILPARTGWKCDDGITRLRFDTDN